MENSQKNTYTAPDGTMYRIEPDGRMVKIKDTDSKASASGSGRYQVSDDGQIFRIEDDGSVTNLGNVEERNNTATRVAPPHASNVPPTLPPDYITTDGDEEEQKSNRGCMIWFIVLGVIAVFGIILLLANNCSGSDDYNEGKAEATAEENYEAQTATQAVEQVAPQAAEQVAPAEQAAPIDSPEIAAEYFSYTREFYMNDGNESSRVIFYPTGYFEGYDYVDNELQQYIVEGNYILAGENIYLSFNNGRSISGRYDPSDDTLWLLDHWWNEVYIK